MKKQIWANAYKQNFVHTKRGIFLMERRRPTKFLGWYLMKGKKRLSPRFKTKDAAQEYYDAWAIFGWSGGVEIRRQFKSRVKRVLVPC